MTKLFSALIILLIGSTFSYALAQQCHNKNCSHHNNSLKTGASDNLRSDTIDVLNYDIKMDFSQVSSQVVTASCEVLFSAKMNNVNTLSLDLLQMSVDSVKQGNNQNTFSYNDTTLVISLSNTLAISNLDSVVVYYSGTPQGDHSGWGGFYFQGNYAYNLGVGFEADPHNYGRVWHPCFDNFVERATYSYQLITPNSLRGYANGLLISDNDDGQLRTTEWKMNQSIPTYLACVAVSDYTHVTQDFLSNVTGLHTPVFLIATPADTTKLKNSFANLFGAMDGFESKYGPYLWDKVGFHLVPFNSGAMEHATSIAYPKATADGSLSYETLMAHELSHHWWGDLVTCRTDADMWINEGMASYSERIFLESVYGYSSYINSIKSNHKDVLLNAHINDGGYYALHGVPHNITYGDHSYNKGADVAHTLRSYMGETEFVSGLQSFLDAYKYQDVDAYDFRDYLNTNTSVDVTPFFDDWIFNAGFPGFVIDSIQSIENGNYFDVTLFIQQKLKGTSHYATEVPLEVTFMDDNWNDTTLNITAGTPLSTATVQLNFNPSFSYLNGNDKISQAVTADNNLIKNTQIVNLNYSMFRYTVNSSSDSSLVRIEHCWVAPDEFKDPNNMFAYYLSSERYWKVDGLWTDGFDAQGRVYFNGREVSGGYLDYELCSMPGFHEDSLKLFYREDASKNWEVYENAVIQSIGSKIDGYGYVTFDHMKKGEYTFGWRKSPVSVEEISIDNFNYSFHPNPVNDYIELMYDPSVEGLIELIDLNGRTVFQKPLNQEQINLGHLPSGIYQLRLKIGGSYTEGKNLVKL